MLDELCFGAFIALCSYEALNASASRSTGEPYSEEANMRVLVAGLWVIDYA